MRLRVYIFAFIMAFAVTTFVRGLFFLTRYSLGMTDEHNLILALISGVTYIIGAQLSHITTTRFNPKTTMLYLLVLQFLFPIICYFSPSFFVLCIAFPLFALANGMTWPFAESYASAGLDRKSSSASIGFYNLSWSIALPLAVWSSGWIISKIDTKIFLFISACILPVIFISLFFPSKIPHKNEDESIHDEVGTDEHIPNINNLLLSARWSMFLSYALLQLLNSLLPGRFLNFGISVGYAGLIAGALDISRTAVFLLMSRTHSWHGKKSTLIIVSPALILSFFACMFSNSILIIIIAECIFGAAAASAYYASLFYALHKENAHVGAGGAHESIIGIGFVTGPIIGLVSEKFIHLTNLNPNSTTLIILASITVPCSLFFLLKKTA